MSRIHNRYPYEWSINVEYDINYPRCLLSVMMAPEQARQLVSGGQRGYPAVFTSLSYCRSGGLLRVTDIEVTMAEAEQIRGGANPLDILFGPLCWPEYGYRLIAVPDTFWA